MRDAINMTTFNDKRSQEDQFADNIKSARKGYIKHHGIAAADKNYPCFRHWMNDFSSGFHNRNISSEEHTIFRSSMTKSFAEPMYDLHSSVRYCHCFKINIYYGVLLQSLYRLSNLKRGTKKRTSVSKNKIIRQST